MNPERSSVSPGLSIVIPTLDEEDTLPNLLADLRGLTIPYEVIVADGGSEDETVEVGRGGGAQVVRSPAGRGAQLRAGAMVAEAPILCFLHADVRLDRAAVKALETLVLFPRPGGFAFRLAIDARGFAYRLIEAGANARSRLFRLPYGDQGLVISRAEYEAVGGYPHQPLMEDVELVRRVRRDSKMTILAEHVTVSARRWRREGPLHRSTRNLGLLIRYLRGAAPEALARSYRPEGDHDG